MIAVLAGGVGAARMLAALTQIMAPQKITAIVNVGDDFVLHGLRISPDLDTVTYTLADAINTETGWGLTAETWNAMETLRRYDGITWFQLGDRDLGTHLYRTQRMLEGAPLSQVTREIAGAWGLHHRLLPVTDDGLRTMVLIADPGGPPEGTEVEFQEYFVKLHHDVPVRGVRFAGSETAKAGPGVLEAITDADTIVIAPSNPIVSIGPIFSVSGVHAAVMARRENVVAVSPIVAGRALKGPADRLLDELGHDASVVGVARVYSKVAATLVIDEADAHLADAVEAEGMHCVVTQTVMANPTVSAELARVTLAAGRTRGRR